MHLLCFLHASGVAHLDYSWFFGCYEENQTKEFVSPRQFAFEAKLKLIRHA